MSRQENVPCETLAEEASDFLEEAKTAKKERLHEMVEEMVRFCLEADRVSSAALETLKGASQILESASSLIDRVDAMLVAAKPFTGKHYSGLVGSTNHIDQSRLVIAITLLEETRNALPVK